MKRRIPIMSLLLVLGTLIMSACAPTQGERINPVEQANLRDTVKIEVMAFDPDRAEGTSPYVQLLTITDTQILDQLLDALDTNLQVALKVACIPEYELYFHLQDGTVQEFVYSCHGAAFIRGEQGFWEGEDYAPSEQSDALIEEQLALNPREPIETAINVVEEAELTSAVEVEVARMHVSSSSRDGIGRREFLSSTC